MPWDTHNTRDTRPEGPAFTRPEDSGEVPPPHFYRENFTTPLADDPFAWPDPPESHDDFRDDVPECPDPVGGGF